MERRAGRVGGQVQASPGSGPRRAGRGARYAWRGRSTPGARRRGRCGACIPRSVCRRCTRSTRSVTGSCRRRASSTVNAGVKNGTANDGSPRRRGPGSAAARSKPVGRMSADMSSRQHMTRAAIASRTRLRGRPRAGPRALPTTPGPPPRSTTPAPSRPATLTTPSRGCTRYPTLLLARGPQRRIFRVSHPRVRL